MLSPVCAAPNLINKNARAEIKMIDLHLNLDMKRGLLQELGAIAEVGLRLDRLHVGFVNFHSDRSHEHLYRDYESQTCPLLAADKDAFEAGHRA